MICTHAGYFKPFDPPWLVPMVWLNRLARNGALGVSLFFVISGFLITTTTLRRYGAPAKLRLREFYLYRVSRIAPPLCALVVLNLIGAMVPWPGFDLPPGSVGPLLAAVFTFRFNYYYLAGGALLPVWAPLWSLAVEEMFYLGYPLLLRMLRSYRVLVPALGALVVFGPIYRFQEGWDGFYLYFGCFDLIALGCLTALAGHAWSGRSQGWGGRHGWQVLGLGMTAYLYLSDDIRLTQNRVWLPTVIALGGALFLFGCAETASSATQPPRSDSIPRWRFWKPWHVLALAGYCSYEIYLFHLPLMWLLKNPVHAAAGAFHVRLPWDLGILGLLVLSIFFGGVVHTWFSAPALRWVRDRGAWLLKTRPDAATA